MAAASLAPSRSPFEYDVFLSFRGPDVRCTFADHLYHALCRSGVRVFRDSEELRAGQKIDELFGVIERSEIFIPIFSENYAHSIWCLKEIGKIVSVAEEGNSKRLILPVFYRIEPSIVRHQTGPFGVAFQKHEQDEAKMETASEWRKALRKVAEFSGYQCGRGYYGDTKDWEEIMKTVSRFRDDRIYRALKVSYDQLSNSDQRSIFLDVACFFSGIDEETAVCIWDACGFSSRLSIKALVHKSLIKKIDGKLEMHDMLREMGKRIVEEEPGTGPEMRSRLWIQEEIMDVLEQQKGTSKIEGINLDKAEYGEYDHNDSDEKRPVIKAAGLASMDKLRLLVMNHVNIKGRCKRMPKRIKGLQWQRCPLKFLPSDFHLKHVAALNLSYSNIIEVQRNYNKGLGILKWLILGGRKVKGPVFQNLKVLDLTACNKLTVTPNLSAFPGLEKLVLDGCNNLVKIHASIANLERLVELSMNRCEKLKEMPYCMSHLISLKLLKLADCFSLESLPYYFDKLISLQELDISNCTSLRNVSMNIDRLMALRKVRFDGCYNLEILAPQYLDTHGSVAVIKGGRRAGPGGGPAGFGPGKSLLGPGPGRRGRPGGGPTPFPPYPSVFPPCGLAVSLRPPPSPSPSSFPRSPSPFPSSSPLPGPHSQIQVVPDCIGALQSLTELLMENGSLVELPVPVGCPRKLEILHLGSCEQLERLPSSIGILQNLRWGSYQPQ
ncbi:Toll/interleukin-1 receptor-like protein [Nymphaea thermarum]|nr:Toll/interleukin-1 receptor-like protein [Nymphaea thermarum]